MEAMKLLPWCISMTVPLHYIRRAVTIAAWQDEGASTVSDPHPTASEPKPHGSPAPGPSSGLTPLPGTSPLPGSFYQTSPWQTLPWWGTPFWTPQPFPLGESETTVPVVHQNITPRGPLSAPQTLKQGPIPGQLCMNKTCLNQLWKLDPVPALNKEGENLPVLPALQCHHHWSSRWNNGRKS